MSRRDEQLARMKGLMTYGIGTPAKKTPVNESIEGADGKIYAVIREGSKYYIKSTSKGKELVTESFDYIGGFMNKKNNEYSSFNQASKNLELKMRSLNEAYGINKPVELLDPEKKESLMVEMTDAMKSSIARYRQIMNNTANIMNEATISASNTGNPEAPKTASFSPKLGEPFTDNAEAKLDKDLKQTANNPEKQGEPFGDNSKAEEYTDAQYVPDGSVANKKPTGGKVVRVNESEDVVETIEECDEWGSCGLPSTPGTGERGDDEPFTLKEDADEFVGFANDENNLDETEEDYDIDLDDIDTELDDEESEEDIDLDDIDDEDFDNEDDIDNEDFSDEEENETNSEIDELKAEIESLRNLVMQKLGNENFNDEENSYEVEIDDEGFDDDEDFDNDFDEVNESYSYITESLIGYDLPFDVKVSYDELNMKNTPYNLWQKLQELAEENNTIEKDSKTISQIRGRLYDMLEIDYYLRTMVKKHFDDAQVWKHLTGMFSQQIETLNTLMRKLSVMNFVKNDMNLFNEIEDELQNITDKYDRYIKYAVDNSILDSSEYGFDNIDNDFDNQNYEVYDDEHYDSDDYYKSDDEDSSMEIDDIDMNYDPDDYEMYESVRNRRLNEEGTKLNVFGKHKGYRMKPMTLPQTGSDSNASVRDWNDESVYSEQPFGEKIGSSAPFDKIVNEIVESIKKKL